MNNPLGLGEVRQIKMWLAEGKPFPLIVRGFSGTHDRDVIVEVVDAIRRTDSAEDALERAQAAIWRRRYGVPQINQMEAAVVLERCCAANFMVSSPRGGHWHSAPWR